MSEPFVSVIVPVRDEERYIERCLYSIAAQDYSRSRFEVLVVDGRSDDRTRDLVARFAAESTVTLRLLDNPRRLAAAAMNVGLGEARGDVIVRLDGHATFAGDYLRRAVAVLDATGADCAGGALFSEGETAIGRAIALAMSSRFGVGGAAFRVGGEGPVDTVAFGAYRRDVFARIGGYAEDIEGGEDDELNYRLLDAGGAIWLDPSLRATYTVRDDLRGLWRQYFRYGRAKPQVLRRHPRQARPRQFVPALFVLALGASAAGAATGRPRAIRLLLGAYGGAVACASLAAARRGGWRSLPLLPAAFACLHLSYGAGFLSAVLEPPVMRRGDGRRPRARSDASA